MKRTVLLLLLLPYYLNMNSACNTISNEVLNEYLERLVLEKIARAVVHVESRGNDRAVGKDNDVGAYQITPIRLRDYNMRTGKHYTRNDLFTRVVSSEIFSYYAKEIGVWNYEQIARCWNGGPQGMKKTATIQYWNLIKKQLNI